MSTNAIHFGWNRTVPGREGTSAAHFEEFVQYLGGLQQQGSIMSFEVVLLNPHGGDLNGFFLIRGDGAKLTELVQSDEWLTHMMRAALHLEGSGAVMGATGDAVMERMKLWSSLISS
ncbi:MAG: hypothetical protein O2968_12045 [Acidobacteria bacterium]|nr:hypothetical protein [Acidobacteriota bacterium]